MFTNVVLPFQQIKIKIKRNKEAALTNMATAKHDFLDKSLRRLKLILRQEHST